MGITWTPPGNDLAQLAGFTATVDTPLAGVTQLSFDHTTNSEGYEFDGCANLQQISFPNLVSIDSSGWLRLANLPAITTVSVPSLANAATIEISSCNTLVSLSFPALSAATFVTASNCPNLASIDLSNLVSIGADGDFSGNPNLGALNILALDFVGSSFNVSGSAQVSFAFLATTCSSLLGSNQPNLASISIANLSGTVLVQFDNCPLLDSVGDLSAVFVPDGATWSFVGCALTDTSVNAILAAWVASGGQTTGLIDTSGGTSQGPSGQGLIDKANLQAAGVTVNTN